MVGGTSIAQLIGILASPALSRLYTPEQFGVLGSLIAVTGIISLVGSLKYEMAIVLENNDKDVEALQFLSHIVLVVVTIISGLAIIASPYWLWELEGKIEVIQLLPWAIVIIFFSGLYNALYSRYNREKSYGEMAQVQILKRVSHVSVQLLIGVISGSTLGLVFGNVFGVLIPVLFIFFRKRSFFNYKKIEFERVRKVAKRYIKFPIYTAPQSLLNLISGQLPVFVLGYFFTMSVVGAYFFAIKIVQLPAMLIGSSVRRVFFKEVAEIVEDVPAIDKLYTKTIYALSAVVLIPTIIVFFYGSFLFKLVFGVDWEMSGHFASWMVLWYGTTIIGGPARSLFLSLEKQKLIFILDAILVVVRGIVLILLAKFSTPLIAIAVFSLITMCSNLLGVVGWKIYFIRKLNV